MTPANLLLGSFRAAVDAAAPALALARHLPPPPPRGGRVLVIAIGKAACSMAEAAERFYPASVPLSGFALTRYGHARQLSRITVIEAGHPVPDEAGNVAARRILDEIRRLGPEDLLLALISGGGSSLLALPPEEISLADLQSVTRALLTSGAPIQETNAVRKHLSRMQGGQLAAECRAPVRLLAISDVAGDALTHIASGPFTPDPTTYGDALGVLDSRAIEVPAAVRAYLEKGASRKRAETPKPGDRAFAHVDARVVASGQISLAAAGLYLRGRGIHPVSLGDSITGEAREVARVMVSIAREASRGQAPWTLPVALLSGGECTVTLPPYARTAGARGGRCSEFLLALAIELGGHPSIHAIACDTDGIDGTEENAGALFGPNALALGKALGWSATEALARHDSYGYFQALDALVVTGPTLTNVNDFRAILILPSGAA